MAKAKPEAAHIGRPALYGPKTVRPGILVTEEADAIARAGAAADKISISDAYEKAIRKTYGGRR